MWRSNPFLQNFLPRDGGECGLWEPAAADPHRGGLAAENWVEDAGHRLVDRMVWREPVESWNR